MAQSNVNAVVPKVLGSTGISFTAIAYPFAGW